MAFVKDLRRVAPDLKALLAIDCSPGVLAADSRGQRYICARTGWVNLSTGWVGCEIRDARLMDRGEGLEVTQQ